MMVMVANVIANGHLIIPRNFNNTTKHSTVRRKLARATATIHGATTADKRTRTDLDPVSTPIGDDDRTTAFWDYQFLFMSQRKETSRRMELRVVDGAIPPEFPSGSYYLIGPGPLKDDHGSTVHPLDGHGYLRVFEIDGPKGEARFMARYVRTEAQLEEHDPVNDRWRFTYRGAFSVLKTGRKLGNLKVMKNVANTSVVKWGKRLLCFWEGGDPYEVDRETLDTVGKFEVVNGREEGLSGVRDAFDVAAAVLKPILYGVFKMPARRILSHYKVDAENDRLLVLSCNAEDLLLPRSRFTFFEYDSSFRLIQKKEYVVPDHLMIHDWTYILFANRIRLDIPGSIGAMLGVSPMISALTVNPGKSTSPVYLLPRSTSIEARRDWRDPIELPSQLWLLHFGNAFQRKSLHQSGAVEITLLACASSYQWFDFVGLFGYDWRSGNIHPAMMNESRGIHPYGFRRSFLNQFTKAADFPVINPAFSGRQNRYIYAATSSGSRQALPHFPFDSVVKLDTLDGGTRTWSTSHRTYIGEPVFVPRGVRREDDGFIVLVEYAVMLQSCSLLILDAKKIGAGDELLARLLVPEEFNFPFGFHGFWDQN